MNWSLAFAVVVAAFMGLAIQRGGTCTVAAVEEVVHRRRARRFWAMLTTAIWVVALIRLAGAAGATIPMPKGFAPGGMAILGGAVLGAGAYVNRACVIGSVARLGSGDWAYLATPLGFFFGALIFFSYLHPMAPEPLHRSAPAMAVPNWILMVVGLLAVLSMPPFSGIRRAGREPDSLLGSLLRTVWTPAHATLLIGASFVVILLLVDAAWTYTDALTRLAHSTDARGEIWRLALFVALLSGAIAGGMRAGKFSNTRPTLAHATRCFFGGMLMAAGSLLIPGSNDGLLLIGVPMLWPYAWLAFLSMCALLALALARSPARASNEILPEDLP